MRSSCWLAAERSDRKTTEPSRSLTLSHSDVDVGISVGAIDCNLYADSDRLSPMFKLLFQTVAASLSGAIFTLPESQLIDVDRPTSSTSASSTSTSVSFSPSASHALPLASCDRHSHFRVEFGARIQTLYFAVADSSESSVPPSPAVFLSLIESTADRTSIPSASCAELSLVIDTSLAQRQHITSVLFFTSMQLLHYHVVTRLLNLYIGSSLQHYVNALNSGVSGTDKWHRELLSSNGLLRGLDIESWWTNLVVRFTDVSIIVPEAVSMSSSSPQVVGSTAKSIVLAFQARPQEQLQVLGHSIFSSMIDGSQVPTGELLGWLVTNHNELQLCVSFDSLSVHVASASSLCSEHAYHVSSTGLLSHMCLPPFTSKSVLKNGDAVLSCNVVRTSPISQWKQVFRPSSFRMLFSLEPSPVRLQNSLSMNSVTSASSDVAEVKHSSGASEMVSSLFVPAVKVFGPATTSSDDSPSHNSFASFSCDVVVPHFHHAIRALLSNFSQPIHSVPSLQTLCQRCGVGPNHASDGISIDIHADSLRLYGPPLQCLKACAYCLLSPVTCHSPFSRGARALP